MESDDIEEIFSQAGRLLKFLDTTFRDVTGEDLDLESAVRHYPLVALGLAAAAGALGGWFLGRRSQPQLPPPTPESKRPIDSLRDITSRFQLPQKPAEEAPPPPGQEPRHPMEYLEQLVPEGMERIRSILPDVTPDEAAAVAREWMDTFMEPKLKQGLESVVANVSESKFGEYLKSRFAPPDEPQEDEGPESGTTPQG